MDTYITPMTEEYRNKHYPNGSVFSAVHKATAKGSTFLYVLMGLFFVLFGLGAIACTIFLINMILSGDTEDIGMGIFTICFFLVLALGCLFSIILTKKRVAGGAEGLVKKSARNSAYDESEIHEFERQAMASDSCVLALTAKYKAALNGQRDGVLTRDYIYLADNLHVVLKYSDIVGAFLVARSVDIMVNNKSKRIDSLTITLVSNKNVQTFVDVSPESGPQLLAILLEKNPQIETMGGRVMQEQQFETYSKGLVAAQSK